MKYLALLALIFVCVACKESTSQFATLDPIDQEYLRTLGATKCRSQYADAFKSYTDTSGESWGSQDYERGDGFRQEYLEGTAVKTSVDFQVWNIIGDDIYFYVIEEVTAPGTRYFLKLNRTQNAEIIAQIAEDYCTKVFPNASVSGSGAVTIVNEYAVPNTTNYDHYVDTYSLETTRPAYLGPYKVKRTITTTDRLGTGGTVIGTAKTYTSTYVYKAAAFTAGILFDNTAYYTQNFCVPATTTGTSPAAYRITTNSSPSAIFKFGYNYTCTTTYPDTAGGWDLSY